MELQAGWWWTSSGDAKIRVIAAAYGLGPRVAAEQLARQLSLGLREWRPASQRSTERSPRLLLNFGVTEPGWAAADAIDSVFIDCLMWVRDRLPDVVRRHRLVLAETFFPTRSHLHSGDLPIIDVRPLIPRLDREVATESAAPLVISFGGVETPFSSDIHRHAMPVSILRALSAARDKQGGPELICFVPEAIEREITGAGGAEQIELRRTDRTAFRGELRRAARYVVQPGLYGPLEAFLMGLPTSFTYPMSYTQCLQLAAYRAAGVHGDTPVLAPVEALISSLSKDVESAEEQCFADLEKAWGAMPKDREAELERWANAVCSADSSMETLVRVRHKFALAATEAPSAADVLVKEGVLP